MDNDQDNAVATIMEQLIEGGPDQMAGVFATMFEMAMRIERERFLGAGQRGKRLGHSNFLRRL